MVDFPVPSGPAIKILAARCPLTTGPTDPRATRLTGGGADPMQLHNWLGKSERKNPRAPPWQNVLASPVPLAGPSRRLRKRSDPRSEPNDPSHRLAPSKEDHPSMTQ